MIQTKMVKILTSESVTSGHPDKMADQISDAVLDEALRQDPNARVACEVMLTAKKVIIAWEIKANAKIDFEEIARDIIANKVGFDSLEKFYDGNTIPVEVLIVEQSPDISQGVDAWWAGDQWLMFGYATNETQDLMPFPIFYAHLLAKQLEKVREEGILPYLYPDGKTQVAAQYDGNKVVRIDSVVVSTQHQKDLDYKKLKKDILAFVIQPVIGEWIDQDTKIFVNPTWKFHIWWPAADTWLTWRKIIVDTYGWLARHWWGAFSGKDPTKVDRSAAYMARYLAKNIVAAWLADRVEIQLSYAIGVAQPLNIYVDTFGTWKVNTDKIINTIRDNFDLSPAGIIKKLDLTKPQYLPTATYGHFWNPDYSWERLEDMEVFKELLI